MKRFYRLSSIVTPEKPSRSSWLRRSHTSYPLGMSKFLTTPGLPGLKILGTKGLMTRIQTLGVSVTSACCCWRDRVSGKTRWSRSIHVLGDPRLHPRFGLSGDDRTMSGPKTMISKQEYTERMVRLQRQVAENGLDIFLVSGEESIYYLTGVSYKPLERPFFIIVRPLYRLQCSWCPRWNRTIYDLPRILTTYVTIGTIPLPKARAGQSYCSSDSTVLRVWESNPPYRRRLHTH